MFDVETEIFDQSNASLDKLEVGPKIAKGSNAVVYAARDKIDPSKYTFTFICIFKSVMPSLGKIPFCIY